MLTVNSIIPQNIGDGEIMNSNRSYSFQVASYVFNIHPLMFSEMHDNADHLALLDNAIRYRARTAMDYHTY